MRGEKKLFSPEGISWSQQRRYKIKSEKKLHGDLKNHSLLPLYRGFSMEIIPMEI